MRPQAKNHGGHEFWLVGDLILRRLANGDLEEYIHALPGGVRPNRYAEGPFCFMALPAAPPANGVYVIEVAGNLVYVGECQDLAARFSPLGYGQIHPRNCHADGQSTNCKLNSRVLAAAKRGEQTSVWFHETARRREIEDELISRLKPPWNGSQPGYTSARRRKRSGEPRDKNSMASAPRKQDFLEALKGLLTDAARDGSHVVRVRAGVLHELVGNYPGADHRMPTCCAAMRHLMGPNDTFVYQPPRGDGARLEIEYVLPRQAQS